MKKIALFTHTDADGLGCSILAKIAFGDENVEVYHNLAVRHYLLNM